MRGFAFEAARKLVPFGMGRTNGQTVYSQADDNAGQRETDTTAVRYGKVIGRRTHSSPECI